MNLRINYICKYIMYIYIENSELKRLSFILHR